MIKAGLLILGFLLGFMIGIAVIVVTRFVSKKTTETKKYGFSDKQERKHFKADEEILNLGRRDKSAENFK